MRMPPGLQQIITRYGALSLRERALVAGAVLVGLWMIWTVTLLDPIAARRSALLDEKRSLEGAIQTGQQAAAADPGTIAAQREKALQAELSTVNDRIAASSAGLIPPERMVQVLHDVLTRQHGLTLVSLRNEPVTALAPGTAQDAGPFVHPVEIVIEGGYLDVLSYLEALEALPWRLYWKVLELDVRSYPVNRVRIELSTLSMDKDWIGV